MSPDQQLAALRGKQFYIPKNQRKALIAKIEAVKAKQDIINGVSQYLAGAQRSYKYREQLRN